MDLTNYDLEMLIQEIKKHLKIIDESTLMIGEILLYIKKNLLKHGEYMKWLQSVDIDQRRAQRMIQAYKKFGKVSVASQLSSGQIYELLSLPSEVDCEEFLAMEYMIPGTGNVKKIKDMTTKEIRAVVGKTKGTVDKPKKGVSKTKDKLVASKECDICNLDKDLLIFTLLNEVVFENILLFSINDVVILSKMSHEEQERAMDTITKHQDTTVVTDLIKIVSYGMSNKNVDLAVEASRIYHLLNKYDNKQKELLNVELDNSIDLLRLKQIENDQLTEILARIRDELKMIRENGNPIDRG